MFGKSRKTAAEQEVRSLNQLLWKLNFHNMIYLLCSDFYGRTNLRNSVYQFSKHPVSATVYSDVMFLANWLTKFTSGAQASSDSFSWRCEQLLTVIFVFCLGSHPGDIRTVQSGSESSTLGTDVWNRQIWFVARFKHHITQDVAPQYHALYGSIRDHQCFSHKGIESSFYRLSFVAVLSFPFSYWNWLTMNCAAQRWRTCLRTPQMSLLDLWKASNKVGQCFAAELQSRLLMQKRWLQYRKHQISSGI